MAAGGLKVGISTPRGAQSGSVAQRQAVLAQVADAGLDCVGVGDHVSFFVGVGFDGLIQAAQLTSLHDRLEVLVGVYLLPLRHPVPVARQIQGVASAAPGRLVFGVGVGGEDPHEYEVCGVDPRTRGRRANEALEIVRGLMSGEPLDYAGEFFQLSKAQIVPAVQPRVPVLVGGRSDAALRRAARLGDGYLGIWISPKRFTSVLAQIDEEAGRAQRQDVPWEHGMFVWCGLAESRERGRELVSRGMEGIYRIGFENFERYTPYGSAVDVADFLRPYVEAGCTRFHLSAMGESDDAVIGYAAEVKRLLTA